ncbi:Satratoxin biosynthesis SC1 cluster protein 4 [Colletotrichum fructicola Nara gc5]|uniref:Satratoxin biosynthesis SC1 cluster protein 4 n=1 Tax=Colletotrichum fructicola (strain Nara gc5) TaxID=1213859 RepID=A0A7J6IWQ2_COLFN|nr:Satratoxin biosynthesis SC1 cluster protein 4 [Colletotrichum fructicola Nara gc5]
MRTYTRVFLLRRFGVDDSAAILTFFLLFACYFAVTINVRNGLGTHVYLLNEDQIKEYLRTFYTAVIFYNAALAGVKMTFLLQYWRLFAVQRMRKLLLGATILVGGWSMSQVLVEVLICIPMNAFWDKSVRGSCIPNYPLWYINAAGNIATDLIVLVLPLPVISGLKLPTRQRYALGGIFCLGLFTCVISAVRIQHLHQTADFTWENVQTAGWSIGEVCSGLICACLPTLRPLIVKFLPSLSNPVSGSSRHRMQHGFSFKRTASVAKQPEAELAIIPREIGPGDSPNRRHTPRLGSSDSEVDLCGAISYDRSRADLSCDLPLPLQGISVDIDVPPPSATVLTQHRDATEVSGHGCGQLVGVETRTEAGRRRSSGPARQSSGFINIRLDVVEGSLPQPTTDGWVPMSVAASGWRMSSSETGKSRNT